MFQRIKEIVDKGRTFLVTTHVDPDGDAVGSAFALSFALAGLGKEAAVYMEDAVPYRYCVPPETCGRAPHAPRRRVRCGHRRRLRQPLQGGRRPRSLKQKGFLINIDHHEANEAFGQINIVDERASSTAEILYLILKALGVRFTLDIAANLYAAVLTDTGFFATTTRRSAPLPFAGR